MSKASTGEYNKEDPKLKEVVQRKLKLHAKILELRAEAAKVNLELSRLGAHPGIIACW